MLIAGQVKDKEEIKEITFIVKLHVVGNRARELSKRQRRQQIIQKQKEFQEKLK